MTADDTFKPYYFGKWSDKKLAEEFVSQLRTLNDLQHRLKKVTSALCAISFEQRRRAGH
jgi:hypothetical protein